MSTVTQRILELARNRVAPRQIAERLNCKVQVVHNALTNARKAGLDIPRFGTGGPPAAKPRTSTALPPPVPWSGEELAALTAMAQADGISLEQLVVAIVRDVLADDAATETAKAPTAASKADASSAADIVPLRQKIEELQEELRQVREDFAPVYTWPTEWKLTPSHRVILSALYRCRGTHLTKAALYRLVVDVDSETDPKIVDVQISNLRKRLKPLGIEIETIFGEGYFLSPAAKQQLAPHCGRSSLQTEILVAAVLVAHASGQFGTDDIAAKLGLRPETIRAWLKAWGEEQGKRKAA